MPRAEPVPARAPAGASGATGGIALLLALVAALAAGYALWRSVAFEREHGTRLVQIAQNTRTQSDTLAALTRQTETLVGRGSALERRIADAETVNRSLREELLGLGERARLVEDAVASLAASRLEGAAALRLNEAELLLRLGTARLSLFRDAQGAIAAYRLADDQLARLDDAMFAGVRQTIAAEVAELSAHGGAPLDATLAELDAIADALPDLPSRDALPPAEAAPAATAGYRARLAHVLGSLVRVRRIDETGDAALAPLDAATARASVELELGLAKAALAAHDDARFARTIARVRAALTRSFDASSAPVRDVLARLERVAAGAAPAALPAAGRALQELSNLRATREAAAPPIGAEPRAAVPAAPGAEAGGADAPAPDAPDETAPPRATPDASGEPAPAAEPT
ncbi:MAG TPA: uroporphyrinogen-III C-methyltransferase [Xanthomonadales bacterium]|nr:uroporphyrinogen-III C-methyltransferase [Xanthomonadales bacterium]